MIKMVGTLKTILIDWQNFCEKICRDDYVKEEPRKVFKIGEIMFGKRKYKRRKKIKWTLVFNEIKR